jgi:hypothetical protein
LDGPNGLIGSINGREKGGERTKGDQQLMNPLWSFIPLVISLLKAGFVAKTEWKWNENAKHILQLKRENFFKKEEWMMILGWNLQGENKIIDQWIGLRKSWERNSLKFLNNLKGKRW